MSDFKEKYLDTVTGKIPKSTVRSQTLVLRLSSKISLYLHHIFNLKLHNPLFIHSSLYPPFLLNLVQIASQIPYISGLKNKQNIKTIYDR